MVPRLQSRLLLLWQPTREGITPGASLGKERLAQWADYPHGGSSLSCQSTASFICLKTCVDFAKKEDVIFLLYDLSSLPFTTSKPITRVRSQPSLHEQIPSPFQRKYTETIAVLSKQMPQGRRRPDYRICWLGGIIPNLGIMSFESLDNNFVGWLLEPRLQGWPAEKEVKTSELLWIVPRE